MATNKSTLSKNIPEHSNLHDSEPNELDKLLGYHVEFEDARTEPEAPKYKMELGEHILLANGYTKRDDGIEYRRDGSSYTVKAQWIIEMEDTRTGEKDNLYVDRTAKAERSFKLAINTRLGGELQRKIGPAHEVTELPMEAVIKWIAKFPIKMRYDFSEWVDEQGNYQRSKKPKLLLWIPEDFQKDEHGPNYIKLR